MPKDQTIELLTEIRDLLRSNQDALVKTKHAEQRSFIMKAVLNTAIVIFVGAASYFYYHTLVTSFGG